MNESRNSNRFLKSPFKGGEIKKFFSSPLWAGGLKLAVTLLCLWYVSRKIDWLLTWQLLQRSNKFWLLASTLLYAASKLVFSFRLNILFRDIGLHISEITNLRLSWLGMFYNLFLPGGIGGDAYKIMLLNKRNNTSVKLIGAAVLLDRIGGVTALSMLAAFYYFLLYKGSNYSLLLLLAIIPALILYYLFIKKVFKSFIQSIWKTLWLGLWVQFLQVLGVYCLAASIGISGHLNEYVLLFLLSSIVAVLPFTIGGLGAREVVFLWGSEQLLLDKHESIYISILFYVIALAVAMAGIRWVYKDPFPKTENNAM